MVPQDEARIERYVRFPATLAPAERDAVTALLAADPTARATASFFQSFYAELDNVEAQQQPGRTPAARTSRSSEASVISR